MTRPVYSIDQELASHIIERQQWIRKIEQQGRSEDQASMGMLFYWVILGIVCTACLLAWVLW